MLPSYEQRARLFKMATPYKNGTTFPPENEEVRTLFVSGLPMDVRLRELYLLFRGFEGYEGSFLKLISSKPGKPPQPIAFVSFKTRAQAEKALEELQGIRFDPAASQTLRLEFARTNSRVSPRQQPTGPPPAASSPSYYSPFTPTKNGTCAYYLVPNTVMTQHHAQGMVGMTPDNWSPRLPMSVAYPGMPHLSSPSPTFSSAPSTPHLSILNILSDSDTSYFNKDYYPYSPPPYSVQPQMYYEVMPAPSPTPTPDVASSPNSSQPNTIPCSTLFVANLELQHTEEEISQLFSSCHGFVRAKMFSRGGPPVAFAEFKDVDSATEAMEKLQGYVLMNSKRSSGIRIEYAKQRMGEPQLKSPSVNGSSTAPSPVQSIIAAHISSETSSSSTSTPSPLAAEFTPQHPSTIIGNRGFGTPVSSGSLNPQAQLFMNGFPSPTIPSSSWSVKPSS